MNSQPGIRKRKLQSKEQNARPTTHKRKPKKPSGIQIHQSLVCLIICAVLVTFIFVLYIDNIPWHVGHRAADGIAKALGYNEYVHAVVIDAGSTGSRVLAFTFHKAVWDGHLVLEKELFEYTKPGLSSFADNPEKGVATISNLIDKAKNEIPAEYWNKTPIIIKATAGLRLLPAKKADLLLSSVRTLFNEIPFVTDDNSVGIMDGTDEGIFSWFTVNFLLQRVGNPVNTVAALDLGGGSTQVTFSATTPSTLKQKEFVHQAVLPFGSIPVYTNSFLGLGLMAARKEILTRDQVNETTLFSACINPIVKNRKFSYGGVDYFVNGNDQLHATVKHKSDSMTVGETIPIVVFDVCSKIVKDYVLSKAQPPQELPLKQIFAFSYYFDRAIEVGLINEDTGGKVTVQQFIDAAKKVCLIANTDQPFMCLDVTFISVLLEHGLGLQPETNIYLYKKVDGHEISWALGAAYNMLKGQS